MTKKSRNRFNKTVTIVLGVAFIVSIILPVVVAVTEMMR